MKLKLFRGIAIALLFSVSVSAQDKTPVKFGDVSAKDFANTVYPIDSNANAVVIADVGEVYLVGNVKGWFSVQHRHFKRVHILKKNGYDAADVSFQLYKDQDFEETLDKIKAVTYNLDNGKVTETRLDTKGSLFKEKLDKNHIQVKFTFPNLREGSIVEFDYTTTSDFLSSLQPWAFQDRYPILWSEFNATIPSFMTYVFLTQGYKTYDIRTSKDRLESFRVIDSRGTGASDTYNFNESVTDYRWVLKNVPALKDEPYITSLRNYINKIEFQRKEYRPPLTYHDFLGTWNKKANDLLNYEYFGQPLSKDNGWMKDVINPVTGGEKDKLVVAQKIFNYVRDNFTEDGYSGIYLDQTLKNLVKSHKGTAAEINLLLTALLKHEDIDADPVILSTRGHGYVYPLYPILEKFNYVICQARINGVAYNLDATDPGIGFGHLPLKCYNGHARVIDRDATPMDLSADSVKQSKFTSVFVITEKNKLVGSFQQTPGYYESSDLRDYVKSKGLDNLKGTIKKEFGADITIANFGVDSLKIPEEPVGLHFDFDMADENGDIIYVSPLFSETLKDNPFKSADRFYPVEMPSAVDELYNLQLEVPAGYVVDEMPKSMIMKLNEADEGRFEYIISQSSGTISLRVRLRLNRANFQPDEYEMLREFYSQVVKKEAEQIVLKKKP